LEGGAPAPLEMVSTERSPPEKNSRNFGAEAHPADLKVAPRFGLQEEVQLDSYE